jgi:hypothetical protein
MTALLLDLRLSAAPLTIPFINGRHSLSPVKKKIENKKVECITSRAYPARFGICSPTAR